MSSDLFHWELCNPVSLLPWELLFLLPAWWMQMLSQGFCPVQSVRQPWSLNGHGEHPDPLGMHVLCIVLNSVSFTCFTLLVFCCMPTASTQECNGRNYFGLWQDFSCFIATGFLLLSFVLTRISTEVLTWKAVVAVWRPVQAKLQMIIVTHKFWNERSRSSVNYSLVFFPVNNPQHNN